MGIPDFTVVIGVDAKHLGQLALVLPTWRRHKPSLFACPWVVFCDGVGRDDVESVIQNVDLKVIRWPPGDSIFVGRGSGKWYDPQRYKMLAGHVHVPALMVETPYWLKLDTDAIARSNDDWIDPNWFQNDPVFIGPKWSYTKPADQMVVLDQWVKRYSKELGRWAERPPLNLIPKPGSSMVSHPRACSWCAFFRTDFGVACASAANRTCGVSQLPVPSQDGYLWYMALRGGYETRRINIKSKGWVIRNSMRGILEQVDLALAE